MAKQQVNDKVSDSQPPCVTLWQQAKALCNQGINSLWERTKILCELIDDEDFLRRFVQADETIMEVFQREVLWDTTTTFAELRTIWEYCPVKATWHEKGLGRLLDEAVEANAERGDEVPRERPRWKERAQKLERQLSDLEAENHRLREENRELRKLIAAEPVAA